MKYYFDDETHCTEKSSKLFLTAGRKNEKNEKLGKGGNDSKQKKKFFKSIKWQTFLCLKYPAVESVE